MLDEEPAYDGIALPEMLASSLGMGKPKSSAFTVYALGGGKTGEVTPKYRINIAWTGVV